MQLSLFDIPQPKIELEELFDAYFNCRINKRNTANALAFEIDYENNLVQLCKEINNGTYQIGRSIAFIVNKPVIREIIVVEGYSDLRAVKAAVDAEVIVTSGFMISAETYEKIRNANERRGVIILTDPDKAGEDIRKKISSKIINQTVAL